MAAFIEVLFCIVALSCRGILSSDSATSSSFNSPWQRVLGGVEADPYSAPYLVALESSRFRGGGVIVNKYFVLTTAACAPDDNFFVFAGVHDLNGEYDQKIRVDRVLKHPKDDIALVRLTIPLLFNDKVQPVILPARGVIHSGDVNLYGWGTDTRMSNVLKTAVLDIVEYHRCEQIFGGPGKSPLRDTNLCTGPLSGGIAPCTGDAGSPIVQLNHNKEVELVGIVSWGFIPCGGANNPQVHIRVSAYIDWILKNLF